MCSLPKRGRQYRQIWHVDSPSYVISELKVSSRQPSSSTALPRAASRLKAISPEMLAAVDHPRIHLESLEKLQSICWFPHHVTAGPTSPVDVAEGLPWLSPINNPTRARPPVRTPILSMKHWTERAEGLIAAQLRSCPPSNVLMLRTFPRTLECHAMHMGLPGYACFRAVAVSIQRVAPSSTQNGVVLCLVFG